MIMLEALIVMEAQRKSVVNYLESSGSADAKVEIIETISQLRVKFPLPQHLPLVSIIIPTKDQIDHLKLTISSIKKLTTYKNYEIFVVNTNS